MRAANSRQVVVSAAKVAKDAPSARYRRWLIVAAALAVVGIVGTVFAASTVAGNDAHKSRQSFRLSSAEVASTLQLAIQHEDDLVVNAGVFLLGHPNGSTAGFVGWSEAGRVSERYPEVEALGQLVVVPSSKLSAFAARSEADSLGPRGRFQLSPPGARPFYCMLRVAQSEVPALISPMGTDLCATPLGPALLAARDSGLGAYFPYTAGKQTWLLIQTPIYDGGGVPATVALRRAAFAGWVGTAIDPKVVLDRALRHHPRMIASIRYHVGSSDVSFRSGTAPGGEQSVTTRLQDGWTVTTVGVVASSGIFADGNSVTVLVAGVLSSLLLAGFMFMLGTGRARALRLVGQRTGELRHQALHDGLTGLPNRVLIVDRIEQLLARSRRNQSHGAVLFLDLDEFKNVNDTLGHEAGDRLLLAVTARLTSVLRDADTIGRMGGDEFVVLLDGASLQVAPELVAERLLDVMRQPFDLDGAPMPLIINVSIGIAIGDRNSSADLLRDADVALYEAKAAGKNQYAIFHPEMQAEMTQRISLEFDLRSALERDQFRLVYQPIYNLGDLTLMGVEALLRWEHPTKGELQPEEFLPTLEQSGQIREVGRWVLGQACEQMAAWHARRDRLDISVNVSGRQLDSDDIVDHVRDALETSGLEATSLIIEVTETTLMRNVDATARRLKAIKELGVRIAVDDFGTGYSSLGYLQQFPVDCLKIDRSFTSAIATSPESKALLRTLVQLGKDLGLVTLAEGIETPAQVDQLRAAKVNEAQGFLFSRPLDAKALEAKLLEPTRPAVPTGEQS